MDIVILNYQTSTVEKICNCPDTWDVTEVEDYLYKTLKYREVDINYMIGKRLRQKRDSMSQRSKGHCMKGGHPSKRNTPTVPYCSAQRIFTKHTAKTQKSLPIFSTSR